MDKYVVLLIPTTLSFPGIVEVQAKCLVQLRQMLLNLVYQPFVIDRLRMLHLLLPFSKRDLAASTLQFHAQIKGK